MTEPVLKISGLSVSFGQNAPAVDQVSLEIRAGETVALVGESGSGKSVTALSTVALLPESARISGSVHYRGKEMVGADQAGLREVRGNDISFIFQEPMTSLNPVLTIGMQLTEPMIAHLEMTEEEAMAKAVDLLGLVGISEPERRLAQYPHHLSGGMRQRVVIAMALACDPKLIIADEPTTALDVTIQAQILELMKTLTRGLGVAMIIITHNLGVVARYADRVNVMYAGRIIESGNASDIYHRPRHPYTLALLKSVPRMDRQRTDKLDPVDGQPPDLTQLDEGCSFRPRCRFATDQCAKSFPVLDEIELGHTSACFETYTLSKELKYCVG